MENTNTMNTTDPTTTTNTPNSSTPTPTTATASAATPSPEEILLSMKENMVPRAEAQQWQDKYNKLFQSVANGQFSGAAKSDEPTEEQLKAAFVDNVKVLSNTDGFLEDRDQVKRLLEFDDYLTSHGRNSCFLPRKSNLTSDDINRAARLRQFLETAVSMESDAQMASWTADHLEDDSVPSVGGSRMFR